MRKIREILRLRFEAKLSMKRIALACRMSSSTVQDTLWRYGLTGLTWPLPADLDDGGLERLLYRDDQRFEPPADTHEPDWKAVHGELRKRKSVTLALLWEEYKADHPEGYQYSWFCEKYAEFRRRVPTTARSSSARRTASSSHRSTGTVSSGCVVPGLLELWPFDPLALWPCGAQATLPRGP